MVLVVCAFLVSGAIQLDRLLASEASRFEISVIQAVIAIAAIGLLAFGFSRMKRLYMRRIAKQ